MGLRSHMLAMVVFGLHHSEPFGSLSFGRGSRQSYIHRMGNGNKVNYGMRIRLVWGWGCWSNDTVFSLVYEVLFTLWQSLIENFIMVKLQTKQ